MKKVMMLSLLLGILVFLGGCSTGYTAEDLEQARTEGQETLQKTKDTAFKAGQDSVDVDAYVDLEISNRVDDYPVFITKPLVAFF